MKARYKTFDGKLEFEVDGSTEKELFKQIAKLEEVFRGEPCGVCKKNDVRLQVRTVEENDFFELKCNSPGCGAVLQFGQHKKGGSLYPKRKDKDDTGKFLPNNGWAKWTGKKETPSK